MRQTTFAKPQDTQHQWLLVDADGQVLGRLASQLAVILMGKHKPSYTPHTDTGDFIVVTNAAKIKLTGRKLDQKFAQRYSRHPGGQKSISYREIRDKHPERLIEEAVRRMLPKNALGEKMLKKLKVYPGADHPHAAQQPEALTV